MLLLLTILIGLTVGGLVVIVLGSRRFARSRSWPSTTGTVTSSRMSTSSATRDGGAITPTVRYVPAGGQPIEVQSSMQDNMSVYRVGRELPVRYNPARPEQMVIDTLGQNGLIFAVIGALFVLLGGAGLVAAALTR